MAKLGIDLKNSRHLMLISVVLGLGILYLYINFLLLPQIRGVAKAYDKARKAGVDVRAAERDASKVEVLKKEVAQYKGKIESYESMLPAEQEIPKLLEDLSGMANNSGVKIIGITPLQSKREASSGQEIYQETPILINAKSGYHELGKFISRLESADRFMKVVDINISTSKASPKRHDVELLVLTYVLLRNG